MKNAAALLLLSRGVPMLLSGDEFMNTQYGNNNAYCQDNCISWLNWDRLDSNRDMFEFFRRLIAFRAAHPVLRRTDYFTGYNSTGYPELSFHGEKPWQLDVNSPFLTFGFMYTESAKDYDVPADTLIYCAVNAHWEPHKLELMPRSLMLLTAQ